MRNIYLFVCLFLTLLLFHGCDAIEYHPYDNRINGATNLNQTMIKRIATLCKDKDTIRIAQLSDTQRWYDETEMLVAGINALGNVDFVIHTGDLTDFGVTKEFIWQRDILLNLQMPFVCVIGNHDCLGVGEETYHRIFGDDNFSFNAGFLHIVGLNTNAFEYDYSSNIPDFSFIKADLDTTKADSTMKTIVAMHAKPFSEQFDNNIADYFSYMMSQYPHLEFCLCGHDHYTDTYYPFNDSIPYYMNAAAKWKSFNLFTITRDSYQYESIQL